MDPQNNYLNDIYHSHDRFFRESMQDIEICKELARLVLSMKTSKNIDLIFFAAQNS